MHKEFFEYLETLYTFTPRYWDNEIKTRNYIKEVLKGKNIGFVEEEYEVTYPYWDDYSLQADGENIDCLPCCFVGGEIKEKNIIDCFIVDEYDKPVITYNKYCSELSTPVMYHAPALSIKTKDVSKVLTAKEISGYVKVTPYTFTSGNILVGNMINPEKILVCHYDSFWGGSCDNGVGTALLLTLADKLDLSKYLLLIGGSEEISLDTPYWCYGYRQFEKKHLDTLMNTKEILIFDSFGYKNNTLVEDEKTLQEGFNIEHKDLLKKTKMYATQYKTLMEIYHSPIDTPDKITKIDFDEIFEIIYK